MARAAPGQAQGQAGCRAGAGTWRRRHRAHGPVHPRRRLHQRLHQNPQGPDLPGARRGRPRRPRPQRRVPARPRALAPSCGRRRVGGLLVAADWTEAGRPCAARHRRRLGRRSTRGWAGAGARAACRPAGGGGRRRRAAGGGRAAAAEPLARLELQRPELPRQRSRRPPATGRRRARRRAVRVWCAARLPSRSHNWRD